MADLITHAALGLLFKRGQRALWPTRPPHLASFSLGSVLPDLLGRVPADTAVALASHGLRVPDLLLYGWGPLHIPAGMVSLSAGLSLLFRSDQRRAVFANLLGGMLLHLLLDLFQDHAGGGYLLLFPLSDRPYELGWLSTEGTLWLAPVLAGLALWAWGGRHPLRRLRALSPGPPTPPRPPSSSGPGPGG